MLHQPLMAVVLVQMLAMVLVLMLVPAVMPVLARKGEMAGISFSFSSSSSSGCITHAQKN